MQILMNEKGQGLTEYIVLLLLIAVISIGAVKTLGKEIKRNITQAKDHLNTELVLTQ
jgi:Flp pilus assembly pilin Flp